MMDLDISLTPPRSPMVESDEMQFDSSPILVGKSYKRTERQEPTYPEYPDTDFVKCQPPINGKSCYKEHCNDRCLIANAWKYQRLLNATEEHHNSSQRKVMGEEMHLNDISEPNSDFIYQVMMYFEDIANIAMRSKNASNLSAADIDSLNKCCKYIEESMLFVCEFVESCDEDTETTDVLVNIFDSMMMISNVCHSSILDGRKLLVKSYAEQLETGKKLKGPVLQWFHCYVHIQSAVLKLLPLFYMRESVIYHIDSTQVFFDNCVEVSGSGFYQKIVTKIFSLSLNLALELYIYSQQHCKTDKGTFLHCLFMESSPFPCLCMQQLLSLCLHTAVQMELKKSVGQDDSDTFFSQAKDLSYDKRLDNCAPMFWKMISVFVSSVIQDVTKKKSQSRQAMGPTLQCLDTAQDALSFCWWWTWEVARLFLFNEQGEYKMRVTSTSHMPLLSKLLRLTFSTCDGDMELMSSHLSCYQTIASFWRSNSDHPDIPFSVELAHFNLLWAHFSKKLNGVKKLQGYGMQKYTTTDDKSISPEKWIRKCNIYLRKVENHSEKSYFVTSDPFKTFLLIFGEILHLECWIELKSKFFSRLQVNEMRTLTDQGLANLFQLFLLVVSSNIDNTERLTVFSKLTSYLEQVSFNKTDYKKLKIMLNGLFSCVHVGLSSQPPIKLQAIAKKCGSTVAAIFKLFSDAGRNLEQRHLLWKIIECYFRNVTQIFQMSSSFRFSQDMLLPSENARQLLSAFKCSEAVSILGNLTAVLSTLRTHLEHSKSKESFNSCTSTVSALFDFFLPWLKILAKTEDNAAEDIVNTLMEMCGVLLQIDRAKPSTLLSVKLSNLLHHFCCSVDIRMQIRCNFVLRILSNELADAINSSNVEMSSCRTAVIQGALKGIICHPDKETRDNIAKSLSNLFVIQDILKHAKSCTEDCFENFLMALRDKFDSLQVEDQRRLRNEVSEWFNPISEIISAVTNSHDSKSVVIYKMCGTIVKHCGSILYLSGNRGLVTQVFDVLVLPRSVYVPRDKSINAALRSALSQTLDIFVIGLLNLDYGRDTYAQRVLRDIVNIYLTRFPARFQPGAIFTLHPFTRVFCTSRDPLRRGVFLKALDNHCRAGPDASRSLSLSLSAVIDILQMWVRQVKETLTRDEASALHSIISKAKFIDDTVTRKKCEFINHKIKEVS